MCLIVDVNVIAETFSEPPDPDFVPVRDALFSGRMKLVHGGRLTNEYSRSGKILRALVQLDRAGAVIKMDSAEVNKTEAALNASGLCVSDDAHIIAVAQLSGARLLCSRDQPLHTDFTNRHLLATPRGAVYQSVMHIHLLRRLCKT